MNISSVIKKKRQYPTDDFRIVRSWKEYTDDRKYMKYLMYELELMEENGNVTTKDFLMCVKQCIWIVLRSTKGKRQGFS